MARSTLEGHTDPSRYAVRQDLRRGAACRRVKTAATCRELLAGETHLRTSLRVAGVDPTNDAAERALRHAVTWRKTSGGTESDAGSPFVERMLSVVATCRQQGRNVLEYLIACHNTDRKSYMRSVRYGAAQMGRIFSGARQTCRQASVAASGRAS